MLNKKIAIVVKYFPSLSETFIINQINSLLDAGLDVRIYAYRKIENSEIHKSVYKYNLLNRVNYFIKPSNSKFIRFFVFIKWVINHFSLINWTRLFQCFNFFRFGKEAYTLKLFYEMQWFLLNFDSDLIHVHFGMNAERIGYLKNLGLIDQSIPLITTFHGYDLEPNKLSQYKRNYKNIFCQSKAITLNTPYLLELIKKVNPIFKNYKILPVGLDTSFFMKSGMEKEDSLFNIVFCGRFVKFKAPDLCICIVSKLHEKGYNNVRLHLIGDGKMKDSLLSKVNHLNLKGKIIFHGSLNQAQVKKVFDYSDVFLLPGRYDTHTGRAETQGLVIQEAQAMELPVVVSNVGGMKYGLIPQETGFLVKENDVNGFCKVIEVLILDNNLRKRMGRKGRNFVSENYDNNVLIDKLLNIYKGVEI